MNAKDSKDDRALAKALVERKLLTLQQAKAALSDLQNGEASKTLEEYLIGAEMVTEEDLLEVKASLWNVPFIDLKNYEVDPEVLEIVPSKMARGSG